jgi:thiamine biosynthesis lipoprotein
MTDSISRDAVAAVFSGTPARPESHTRRFALMGGSATITVVGGTATLLDRLVALADRCEALWSRFLPTSDITRLNWSEGRETAVDPLTIRLIRAMIDGADVTAGAFDPTLLPDLLDLGYTSSIVAPELTTSLPSSARAPGRLSDIVLGQDTVTMPVGTTLDAGGIGKGLAADLITELGMAEGAWGVLAEISGDVVVAGEAPGGAPWRVGVEDPFGATEHRAIMRLTRGALVTSSQRKRRFGDRHHLLDPSTHRSADTRIQTVSVIAATGARAEAMTKPGFLRDSADYLAWLPLVGAAGLLIDDTGAAQASENWDRYL